jgi:3-hydroxyacyl-[acyl-carrier-protein] dehydratase
MLQNKLYYLSFFEVSETGEKISAQIHLNREHPVFEGHFPGNPILPGVCTVQIILELLEKALVKELMLTRAGNIKYLGFISPETMTEVRFDLVLKKTGTNALSCSASVLAGGNVVCSFKGEYLEI